MRMLLGVVAVLGALATGAVPAVVVAAGDTGQEANTPASAGPAVEDAATRGPVAQGPARPVDKNADGKPGFGPPPHAQSRHNADKSVDKDKSRAVRPKGPKVAKKDKASRHAEKMSSLGRAHAQAMRVWSRCVDEQPGSSADGFDPEGACGAKPVPPGHLKHKGKLR